MTRAATTDFHPVKRHRAQSTQKRTIQSPGRLVIPADKSIIHLRFGDRDVRLTNLQKVFWPKLKLTKRDLLQYYIDVSDVLLPHVRERAMVMKRYPNGASGEFFFMKRAPSPRPEWIETCSIEHSSGNVIDFPVIGDLPSLLWLINLGCIDLNPWYARCDDVDRPDYVHFDLDPVPGASFKQVRDVALMIRDTLGRMKLLSLVKTSGSKGLHVYVPIVRGPTQKQVWTFAKHVAQHLEKQDPQRVTAQYQIARRPRGRVLVDYNQNAWGRTLASVYSVRPTPKATVSTPITWEELKRGVRIEEFTIENVPQRVRELGDLWKPLLDRKGRVDLERYLRLE